MRMNSTSLSASTPDFRVATSKRFRMSTRTYNVRASELAHTKNTKSFKSIKCIVHFLDDTEETFEIDKRSKGSQLLESVFTFLELIEKDYFGLQYNDPSSSSSSSSSSACRRWLDPAKTLKKQIRASPPYVFHFRVKFYVIDPSKLQEEYTRYHFFLQLRRDVATGRLPCSTNTGALLASYAAQSELGDFAEEEHREESYLDHLKFVPNQNEDFAKLVAAFHRQHAGQTPAESEFNYLVIGKQLELYGIDLHNAKIRDSTNKDIQIGVSATGLVVFHNDVKVNTFSWARIVKISFKRRQFFIQVRGDDNCDSLIGYNLASYRACKNLWKSCVEHHTFFRLHVPAAPSGRRHFFNLGSKLKYRASSRPGAGMPRRAGGSGSQDTIAREKESLKKSLLESSSGVSSASSRLSNSVAASKSNHALKSYETNFHSSANARRNGALDGKPTSTISSNTAVVKRLQVPGSGISGPGSHPQGTSPPASLNSPRDDDDDGGFLQHVSKRDSTARQRISPSVANFSQDGSTAGNSSQTMTGSENSFDTRASPPPPYHVAGVASSSTSSSPFVPISSSAPAPAPTVQPISVMTPSVQQPIGVQNAEAGMRLMAPAYPGMEPSPLTVVDSLTPPLPLSKPLSLLSSSSSSILNPPPPPHPPGASHHKPIPIHAGAGGALCHPGRPDPSLLQSLSPASLLSSPIPMGATPAPMGSAAALHPPLHPGAAGLHSLAATPSLPDLLLGLCIIRIKADEQGRFGFNVKGGADQGMPIIVSRVAPSTPADLCVPRLNEGDQLLLINGRDVSQLTHTQVVDLIRSCRETSLDPASATPTSGGVVGGELVLTVRPNAEYIGEDISDEEPDFQYIPESPRVAASLTGDLLGESLLLLQEGLESGAAGLQFEQLYRRKPGETLDVCRRPENMPKNRYRDVFPYDSSRVVLRSSELGDYINASHVNMEIPTRGIVNRYIACQGPLPNTTLDFWLMCWETGCSLVVMLTTTVERGRVKCHQYWPDLYETMDFGNLQCTCLKEEITPAFAFREFTLTSLETNEERVVHQMQYIAWPDHGVPADATDFLEFTFRVRQKRAGMSEPTVVHCSAGIGRTGVLILMETALCLMESNEPVYPLDIVRSMRDQRAMLIQTGEQYRFVCDAVLRVFREGLVKPLPEHVGAR